MKRKTLFFISALILFSGFWNSSETHAEINYGGQHYYTVYDMVEIGKEVESFKVAECGENYDHKCGQNVFERLFLADNKYRAYSMFQNGNLILSSFNPSQNTAKVFYRDKDDMSWFDDERHDLKKLYIYWLDPSIDKDSVSVLKRYIATIKDGTYDASKVHVLYAGDQPSDFEWLTFNSVSTLTLNDDAGYSATQTIRYHAVSNGDSYGQFNLHECLNSPDYEDGMECAEVYNKDGIFLIPIAPQSPAEETQEEHDEESSQSDNLDTGQPGGLEEKQHEELDESDESEEFEETSQGEQSNKSDSLEGQSENSNQELSQSESESNQDKSESDQDESEPDQNEPKLNQNEPLEVSGNLETPGAIVADINLNSIEVGAKSELATNELSTNILATNASITTVTTPNTGSANIFKGTTEKNAKTPNREAGFSWWLFLVITSLVLIFIWLFIPVKRKNKNE